MDDLLRRTLDDVASARKPGIGSLPIDLSHALISARIIEAVRFEAVWSKN
jgi:hypothetical protein